MVLYGELTLVALVLGGLWLASLRHRQRDPRKDTHVETLSSSAR